MEETEEKEEEEEGGGKADGREEVRGSTVIILIEINFKYPQIKASFHGRQRLGAFSQAHDDSCGEGV